MKSVYIYAWFIMVFTLKISTLSAQQPIVQIFTENVQQGSMIIGRALIEGDVYYLGNKLATTDTGEFVFGVGRQAPASINLVVKTEGKEKTHQINVSKRDWKIERIDGLPPEKVEPRSEETLKRIKLEAQKVAQARSLVSGQNSFLMNFISPAKGRISGVYGSQRILNGIPKRPHFGQDIANRVGTPIVSPADGVVTLAEDDLFFSGGTIIIDHGYGIFTSFLHLSEINVAVGDELKQGEPIGKMGATGRATGSHLDWRLNWQNIRLDPALLVSN